MVEGWLESTEEIIDGMEAYAEPNEDVCCQWVVQNLVVVLSIATMLITAQSSMTPSIRFYTVSYPRQMDLGAGGGGRRLSCSL